MTRDRGARLVLLCAGAAVLAAGGVLLVRLVEATSAPPAPGTATSPAADVGGAAASAPPGLAAPAAAGRPVEGMLEVLVQQAGVPRQGAEVRLYSRHGVDPGTGAPVWRQAGSTATDADGVAALPAAAGAYLVAARAAGLAPRHAMAVRRSDEARTRVTLSLEPGVAVAGRVLARDGGEPVPYAALSLLPADDAGAHAVGAPTEERASRVADRSGRFRLEVAPGPYLLEASAAGFSRARVWLAAPQAAVEVRLAPGAVVEGSVRGPDGAPAAGAEVLLVGGGELVRGAAGPSGGFAVEVTPGSYSVTARSLRAAGAWPAPVTVAAAGRAQGIAIVLGSPGAIAGVVTGASGTPVRGASVTVSLHGASGEVAGAETDAGGRFALEPLGAGTYDVAVTADGWAAAVRRGLALLAGERADLAVALERGGGVAGTVRDGAGKPLAGVRVRAGSQTMEAPGAAGAEARTDAAGRYRIEGLDPGRWEVTAARDDASSGASASVTVPPGSLATADFALQETGWLEGLVTRPDRGPVGGAVVVVLTRGSPVVAASAKVGADGRYGLQLAAGEYRVAAVPAEADAPGGEQAAASVRIAPGQSSRVDLTLSAPADGPGGPAIVQVLEPGGSASAGSLVLITTADDLRGAGSSIADEDGMARLDLPERASLLVRAFHGGRVGGPVPLAASGPTVVVLRAAARLRGRVVAPDGPPPAGFTLELVALGDDASVASTVGGAEGVRSAQGVQAPRRLEFGGDRFDVSDVPAGPVRVLVQTPIGRLARAELVLAPGELRDLELVLEAGATVQGRVIDARRRSPVAGASVMVLTGGRAPPRPDATTDAEGRFRLTGLQAGARRLRLVAPGYAAVEREAEIDYLGNVDLGDVALGGASDGEARQQVSRAAE